MNTKTVVLVCLLVALAAAIGYQIGLHVSQPPDVIQLVQPPEWRPVPSVLKV